MPTSPPKGRTFKRLVMPDDFKRLRNIGAPVSNRFTRTQHTGERASNTSSRTESRAPAPSKSISTSKPEVPITPPSAERTRFDRTREPSSSPQSPGRVRIKPGSNEDSVNTSRPEAPSAPLSPFAYNARSTQTRVPASPRIERPQRPAPSSPPATPSRPEPIARPLHYKKFHPPEVITPETACEVPRSRPVQRTAEPVSDRRRRPPSRQPPNSAPRRTLKSGCPFVPEEPAQPRKEAMLAVHRSNIRRMKGNAQQLRLLLDMEKESVETKQLQLRRCTDKRQIPRLQEGVGASEKKVCGFEKEMQTLLALIEEEQEERDWVWWDEGFRGMHGEMQKLQEVEAKRVWDEWDGILVTESVLR